MVIMCQNNQYLLAEDVFIPQRGSDACKYCLIYLRGQFYFYASIQGAWGIMSSGVCQSVFERNNFARKLLGIINNDNADELIKCRVSFLKCPDPTILWVSAIKFQRWRSGHDQIWAKKPFGGNNSIQMFQVWTFVCPSTANIGRKWWGLNSSQRSIEWTSVETKLILH